MRVPLSWLKDFTPLPTDPTDADAVGELGRVFDSLGLVVEGIEHVGVGLEGVVLARVLEIRAIPGADRIRHVLVDAGGAEATEVVCGAWNFEVGDVVPLARLGTTLPNGMTIAKRKLRGVTSEGMLCSPPELGLPGEGSGLLVLAGAAAGPGVVGAGPGGGPGPSAAAAGGLQPGRPLADYLGIEPDAVFDLAIEPNRPDCLSIVGVARDLAARLRLDFAVPEPAVEESGAAAAELAAVATSAPGACDRIVGRVVTGLRRLASPALVARRLVLAGMRPIDSVVDATNYVMLELGQPTHAYDLDRLAGHQIVARLARPGERLVTLDGTEHVLGRGRDARGVEVDVEECVIADGAEGAGTVVGLAGVMGGADSEVGPQTSRVLLEAAHFDGLLVARAAKRRGLRSEASARFERGVDPEGTVRAATRVTQLIVEAARSAGAPLPAVAPGVLEDRPVPPRPVRVHLRTDRLNTLLGTQIDARQAAALLAPIGFSSTPAADGLEVEVPSFRPDSTLEVDLIEEVARHYGYERIAPTPRRSPKVGLRSRRQLQHRRLLRLLAGTGALEAWTPSIVDPLVEARLGGSAVPLRLTNPIVAEESALRSSLLPGLLAALRHNVAHRNPNLRLFEHGAVFAPPPDGAVGAPAVGAQAGREQAGREQADGEEWPEESRQLAVVLAGEGDDAAAALACWRRVVEGLRLDQSVLTLLQGREIDAADVEVASAAGLLLGLHPSRRGVVQGPAGLPGPAGPVAALGELDPGVVEGFELGRRRIGVVVVDLDVLAELPTESLAARSVSRFPSSDLDLAFVLAEEVPAERLRAALVEAGGERCEWVRLLDVYRGAGLDPGTRSLAYRLRFSAPDHTLEEAELSELRRRCIDAAESRFPARLRG